MSGCGSSAAVTEQVHGPCPFYLARELAANAELVFMPYNYLVDTKTRTSIKQLSWEGSILIFDEAHNLEVGRHLHIRACTLLSWPCGNAKRLQGMCVKAAWLWGHFAWNCARS